MPTVKAGDGTPLHYAVHDYTDRWRKAETIILIHGFARSGEFWFNMVPYLARFYRVICPDLRGLGQSTPLHDPARALSLAAYIGDIEAVADHAGAANFHLVGEAIGGAITLIFAAERPQRLRTLSVLAPAVWANDWIRNAYAVGFPSWVEAIRALGVEGWVRKSNTLARFPAGFDPAFMDWYAKEVGKADVDVVTAMVDFAGSVDAKPYLQKITGADARALSDRQQYLLRRSGSRAARQHRLRARDASRYALRDAGHAAAAGLRRTDPEFRRRP